jgi:hypothetical protein
MSRSHLLAALCVLAISGAAYAEIVCAPPSDTDSVMWAVCLREPGVAATERVAVLAKIDDVLRAAADARLVTGAKQALAISAITDDPDLRRRITELVVAHGLLPRAAAVWIPYVPELAKRLPRVRGRLLDPRLCEIGAAPRGLLLVDCTQFLERGCNDWKHRAEVVFHVGPRGWKLVRKRVEREYTGEYCL